MAKINKEMTVIDALRVDTDIANILMEEGMHCIFCGGAFSETLQQAGYVHGINDERMDEIISEINEFLARKETKDSAMEEALAAEDAQQ